MAATHEAIRNDYLAALAPSAPPTTYSTLVHRDPSTGRYTVTVPDLPGFTCQGDTPEEATRIVRDAIVAWANNTRSSGGEIPVPAQYELGTLEVPAENRLSWMGSAASQFEDAVAGILALTDDARAEFLIAESAVVDERFPDATRHIEWCIDQLMQARARLARIQPHGELERVHKLLDYSIALAMQGARKALQGTCERNVDCVRSGEDLYVRSMEGSRSALSELHRLKG